MTLDVFIGVVIAGLACSYWAGVKVGVAVRMLKNLGNHA